MFRPHFFAVLFFVLGAANAHTQIVTKGGNRVTNHTNNQGPKANYGNMVLLSVDTWVNDSLIQSTTRDAGGPREIAIPDSVSIAMKPKVAAVFEALFLMAKGDRATVIQPLDSIMKRGIPKGLGEVKEIRYEVTLEEILTPEFLEKRQAERRHKTESLQAQGSMVAETVKVLLDDYKTKRLKNVQKSDSGLEYVIIEQGTGAPVQHGDTVPTSYYGARQSDGVMFDNSYDRGGPNQFKVGMLVAGFNEGMKLLNRGGKALLFIPSRLAYGDKGIGADIPPNTDLVFYIEMGQ